MKKWMFDPDNHGIDSNAGFGILDEDSKPTGITIHGWFDDEEARAKGRFVAVGPELLDCLDDLVTWFDCNPDVDGLEHEGDDFLRRGLARARDLQARFKSLLAEDES